ncbi:MAG: lipopolysaccharide core heptose(II) kinase RfaY [Fusobacterium gastrosuis]|uniref:lipopolysaccharide core heptose(II) kinase RfaY n=1 Tax=Fusobacterium gastrosuis TaxID=1755100 RepID=UPI002A896540|nr:lipopolysaccharide core heptose(II) kinase RfaY [Fusobacterium gastrosuis]
MIEKEKYNQYNIYSFDTRYIYIAKEILERRFSLVKVLKDTKRNYVALIKINQKKYVYKEARNEYQIPQRKFFTLLKKGEAVETLKNINHLIEIGFSEYVRPLVAVNRRKSGMINFSFILMEYIDGTEDRKQVRRVIDKMKEIHEKGYYHGDFNPSNFIFSKDNKLHILDTQGKKMIFGNYRAHYDMLTMIWDSFPNLDYPIEKNIFYFLAVFIKSIKKLAFIKKIKKYKKSLRENGWKI